MNKVLKGNTTNHLEKQWINSIWRVRILWELILKNWEIVSACTTESLDENGRVVKSIDFDKLKTRII